MSDVTELYDVLYELVSSKVDAAVLSQLAMITDAVMNTPAEDIVAMGYERMEQFCKDADSLTFKAYKIRLVLEALQRQQELIETGRSAS